MLLDGRPDTRRDEALTSQYVAACAEVAKVLCADISLFPLFDYFAPAHFLSYWSVPHHGSRCWAGRVNAALAPAPSIAFPPFFPFFLSCHFLIPSLCE
jgi:hypothetical protein